MRSFKGKIVFNAALTAKTTNKHLSEFPHRSTVEKLTYAALQGKIVFNVALTAKEILGTCWNYIDAQTSECFSPVESAVTKRACCRSSSLTRRGWSPKVLSNTEYALYKQVGSRHDCQHCVVSCRNIQCGLNEVCKEENDKAVCKCSDCADAPRNQICSSGFKTFDSECHRISYLCKNPEDNFNYFNYNGSCKSDCSQVICPSGRHCVYFETQPICILCSTCNIDWGIDGPVCGTDNRTYDRVCTLNKDSCLRHNGRVKLAYNEPCRASASCDNVKCNDGLSCLVSPDTHMPRCFECYDCHTPRVSFQDDGPFCATNGKTYQKYCRMVEDACQTKTYIGKSFQRLNQ
ncbi:hypothetical protein HELRODRAFT_188890 [Helobdella robusta]|uniref:Kazal-like domain-containing protein n=1 Tax=Helobdella robusta TaxID=6412 RepID=T1FQG1_HELRO|nr:hypothetical protein HELRODRAFT_188890 [Helobdella robusta]ESN98730.1 hypothetical protein HELRODRAFT_188890 [Helobdella robusta]